MTDEPRYWFRAKRYGFGWGPPVTWQGWVVIAAYVALLLVAQFTVPPAQNPGSFSGCVIGLSILLVVVCAVKGEPPRWRWGGDDQDR